MERSANLVDGIAYLSYALLAALIESLILFFFLFLISNIMPKRFNSDRILAQLGFIAFGISLWLILEQLFAYIEFSNPGATTTFFLQFSRPYLITLISLALLLGLLILTIALPFYLFNKRFELVGKSISFFERLLPLSIFYLAIDALALIFVILRNFA